jgi:hypothetical protein
MEHSTNPLRSYGFAPYIQFMIESMVQEKFYKDPRGSHAGSSATPTAAPSHTTRSGGAASTPAPNSGILKMLWGIVATCRCTDQHMDVMDQ